MKRKKSIRIIFAIATFCFVFWLTNFTIISEFVKRDYSYSNFDGSYTFQEYGLKGVNWETVKLAYPYFLEKNPDIKDKILYRTFHVEPWRFWEWREMYVNSGRFKLPYISKNVILQNKNRKVIN